MRDAIADVLGKLISKGLEIMMTAGVGTAAAIASLVADAGQWAARLSREARSVVTTSSNLGPVPAGQDRHRRPGHHHRARPWPPWPGSPPWPPPQPAAPEAPEAPAGARTARAAAGAQEPATTAAQAAQEAQAAEAAAKAPEAAKDAEAQATAEEAPDTGPPAGTRPRPRDDQTLPGSPPTRTKHPE